MKTPDEKMISSWHVKIGEYRVSVFPYTQQYSECRQYSGLVTDHRKMADAKLIAAAPDLLAVLQAFERISDAWLPAIVGEEHEGETRALHQARNDMLAAIAKATQ